LFFITGRFELKCISVVFPEILTFSLFLKMLHAETIKTSDIAVYFTILFFFKKKLKIIDKNNGKSIPPTPPSRSIACDLRGCGTELPIIIPHASFLK
jgi:hypothetical protein